MITTVRFEQPLAARLDTSGGKGANLARLTQRQFPVPPGFIVTAATYRAFIAAAAERIREVDTFPFDDPAALRTVSEALQSDLEKLPLPSSLAEEVERRLEVLLKDQAVSVRSSSTMEDLASAAFAGQHETFLNVQGAEAILGRIKACWLSLWHVRAIAYRHQQGFDHQAAAMAVVVQAMVNCDVAGVAFSVNPVSGDLGELCVDANYGLGESVVSGEGAIDHWTLDRATGKVGEARIARKDRMVVSCEEGIEEVSVHGEEAEQACLTDAQLGELADLVLRIEVEYGFPQDIEWGYAQGRLHLLQSRPITSIPPRWTRDESAERFPNVITPLTWDFVEEGFHRSLDHSLRLMGLPPFQGKWFGQHGHYIYGNQNAVELYARRSPLTLRSLEELRVAIPQLREQFRWVLDLPVAWARDLDYYLIRLGEFLAEPLSEKGLNEVWQLVLTINQHGADYFLPNIAISITHGTLYRLLHQFVRLVVGPDQADSLFDALMVCDTKTGQINQELFELAQLIRERPALERELRTCSSRTVLEGDIWGQYPEITERLDRFLRDHGHREVDFDAHTPTWLECPWIVLDNVRLILNTPMRPTPAEKERTLRVRRQEAEFTLFQLLPQDLHFFGSELLRLARTYTSLDDLEHYQTTRLTLALRRGLRELGDRLVVSGVLDEAMDVFFAHRNQIDQAIGRGSEQGWADLAEQVRQNKAAYLTDQARSPEWILGQSEPVDSTEGEEGGMVGLAGSPGVAEGPVYRVLTPDDFATFPQGAVLVARTTNPTWTPLFYSAVAVVTESGGPLSHGAVTAREMNIPAVMSAKEVLHRLRNGQRVRVDGARGRVQLLEP